MKVTIYGENKTIGITEKYEGVDFDLVTIKEVHKRNGFTNTNILIENGQRHIVLSSGVYNILTVQDEETGRFLLKVGA